MKIIVNIVILTYELVTDASFETCLFANYVDKILIKLIYQTLGSIILWIDWAINGMNL